MLLGSFILGFPDGREAAIFRGFRRVVLGSFIGEATFRPFRGFGRVVLETEAEEAAIFNFFNLF